MQRSLVVCLVCAALALPLAAIAKGSRAGGGGRVHYSGASHTSSHGGAYKGGKGSSHKGGDYKNSRTNNQYGKHKP